MYVEWERNGFAAENNGACPLVARPAALVIAAVEIDLEWFGVNLNLSHKRGSPFNN